MMTEQTTNMVANTNSPQDALVPSSESKPVEGVASEAVKSDPMSAKFAALARKEKQIRQMARRFQSEKQSLEAQKVEIEKYKNWDARLNNDPISVLLERGYTPDQIAQKLLNQNDPQASYLQKLENKIQELENAQSQSLKKMEQAQSVQYEQARKQIASDVKILVDGNEEYESIQAMGAQEAVVELIEQVFNKDGIILPIEQAAKEVEDYCLEQAKKIAGLKKLQAKSETQQNVPRGTIPNGVHAPMKNSNNAQVPANTLSNRGLSTARPETYEQKRERIIAIMEGRLPPQ